MRAFLCRAESFFGGKVDVLVNNAGVSPVLPFDTVMKVHIGVFHKGGFAILKGTHLQFMICAKY